MTGPDKRLNAWRDDLADRRLEGRVEAARFVDGAPAMVMAPRAGLRSRPDAGMGYCSEALFGDVVDVFETRDQWAWVQMQKDGYVGYMRANVLAREFAAPTHRICVTSTLVFREPDLKSQPARPLYLNSRVRVSERTGDWTGLATGGFVYAAHLSDCKTFSHDPVNVALDFTGTPYLWGGSSAAGLDCSGLVQQAFHACGQPAPRDSDMLEKQLGRAIEITGDNPARRGDLVFWDGHAGMMCDAENLLHANGFHMAVRVENFAKARERIAKAYGSQPRFRRVYGNKQ
ncbi:MAG TPA: peptidoglycan endopeptidase [Rhizobiales bacterium]|nr:peptidoglycan endopeptidase [Hyphomicrobiales bacterium]